MSAYIQCHDDPPFSSRGCPEGSPAVSSYRKAAGSAQWVSGTSQSPEALSRLQYR
uniref:Uncharacterized protein n=1 Tax=Faecalibaculum rodentium TaxID=1702221 RepID=A0A140DWQ5_9FIRM|nr:hypothetical protein AALO17_19480 [Faecalibaculum rodentium]